MGEERSGQKEMETISIKTENQKVIELIKVLATFEHTIVVFDDGKEQVCHKSDAEIAEAIELLLKDFAVKTQWVAIYRILVDYYGFPKPFYEFCNRIQKMMPRCHSKYACTYQAIQKGIGYEILAKPYENWKEHKPKDADKSFRRQLHTAKRFLELLGEG